MTAAEQNVVKAGKNSPFWNILRREMEDVVRRQEEASFGGDDVLASNMRARGARDLRNALISVVEADQS